MHVDKADSPRRLNGDNRPSVIAPTASAYGYPLLLKQLLHSAIAHAPEQEIVYRDSVRFDYRTLMARIGRLADGLSRLGLRAGETVGMLDWDSHRYLESYFAVPGMGAVLHTVNVRLSLEQILYTINHARDDVLLVHVDFLPLMEALWDRVERVRSIVVLTDDGSVPVTSLPIDGEYEAMLAAASSDFAFPDFDENARATTFYTTGTTGAPKGVFFSHRQIVLHTLAVAAAFGASPQQGRLHRGDVYMPITPMFHVHAWGVPFIATMLGLKQVYPGRYAPDMLIGLHQREGVTFSHCVPTLLQMLLACPESAGADLSGWKMVIGGSALTKALTQSAVVRGIDIFAGYGMSETCPILTVQHLKPDLADESGAIETRTRAGMPVPLVDLRVVDAAMTPQTHDGKEQGEVVVRSPWLTQGYLRDTLNSERLWEGGWLHTGDVGVISEDGSLQITDRIKDLIKTGGEWISSLEIEDLIARHEAVGEVAVIAIPDAKWGERPVAILVARQGHDRGGLGAAVREHLQTFADQGVISQYAIPVSVIVVDALEKTSVGKTDKKKIREIHGASVKP